MHCTKDKFRPAFSKIGELQSIIPDYVHMLALTATATKDTVQVVCSRLSLVDSVVIALPMDRSNLMLTVKEKPTIEEYCKQLSQDFNDKRMEYPKTIIFCHSYTMFQVCMEGSFDIWELIKPNHLGTQMYVSFE